MTAEILAEQIISQFSIMFPEYKMFDDPEFKKAILGYLVENGYTQILGQDAGDKDIDLLAESIATGFKGLSASMLYNYFKYYAARNRFRCVSLAIFQLAQHRYYEGALLNKAEAERLEKQLYTCSLELMDSENDKLWIDNTVSDCLNDLRFASGRQDNTSIRMMDLIKP